MRQKDTNYYKNQNLCLKHPLLIFSRRFQEDQQGNSHSFSSLFSCAGSLLFPCSAGLKPSTLRRTLVFAFWGCSKSNSLNGLSSTSLTWKQLTCCPYFTSSLPISHLACFVVLTRRDLGARVFCEEESKIKVTVYCRCQFRLSRLLVVAPLLFK